ncbi:hypothetical protein EMGBS15_09230 [Filimonas sp.]|nr:hypothetical protein EMGBS15_09230 [Filimonas sp.]
MYDKHRNSEMQLGEIYFWTATIRNWYWLLEPDSYKEIIIGSLRDLSNRGLIDIFAFVIMPNHLHMIWRLNKMNGKESPKSSFLKFTAHQYKKVLSDTMPENLLKYKVKAVNKNYEFWKRDPLAIILYTKEVALQKLAYIHSNPLASHWNLANSPSDYYYSSAKYYERDQKNFDFLKDLLLEF